MNYTKISLAFATLFLVAGIVFAQDNTVEYDHSKNPYYSHTDKNPVKVTDEQWRKILPPAVYQIAREQGTERAYTGKYWDNHSKGNYYCAVCGNHLFISDAKFDSHTGWPSFYQPFGASSLYVSKDADGQRDEVECKRCRSHLGHVFDDGPPPTGKRYCMDGNVLDFTKL